MTAALGKFARLGPFSFVVGVVAYFALATGFLVWAALKRGVYKNWMLFAAGTALLIGIAVSGSRSVVGACAVVVASLLLVLFLRPGAVNRFGQALACDSRPRLHCDETPVFREGLDVLTTRFSDVAESEEQSIVIGLISRVFDGFSESVRVFPTAPFFGFGLGIGTNGGAKFLTGQNTFLLWRKESGLAWFSRADRSWPRFSALAFRPGGPHRTCSVSQSVRRGNVLPLLLFSSSGMPLMNGQFGPPTILGFAVFTTGLALAARNVDDESEISTGPARSEPVSRANRGAPLGLCRASAWSGCSYAIKAMVLLIGNYPPDRQQSMHRFALMMLDGLTAAGVPAELIQPQPFFGRFQFAGRFVGEMARLHR